MAKQLMFDDEARRKILEGIRKLAGAVKKTMGPSGRTIVIEKKFGAPEATRDGVTVSKEVELEDPFENIGAKLANHAADKTNDDAGDGKLFAHLAIKCLQLRRRDIEDRLAGCFVYDSPDHAVDGLVERELHVGLDNPPGLRRFDGGARSALQVPFHHLGRLCFRCPARCAPPGTTSGAARCVGASRSSAGCTAFTPAGRRFP